MTEPPKTEPPPTEPSPTGWSERFEELYRDRYGPMVRLATLVCGDAAVAEEIVQDAFVAVHAAGDRVDHPPAYLRRAVVNGCHSWGRRQTLRAEREPATDPGPAPSAEETADLLWDSLHRLPLRQRTAVVLRFYEDLPDREIAAVLDCREATVRTTIHRALLALRQEIDR